MKPEAKQRMERELRDAPNMAEAFKIVGKYYDLENCKPSLMQKQIVLPKIVNGMNALGAKARREYA